MKKSLFVFMYVLAFVTGYTQGSYPVSQNLGAPATLVIAKGGLKADSSLIIPAFTDTAKANISPYLNKYAGSIIRVGDVIYMRNYDATQWIAIQGGGGAQTWTKTAGVITNTAADTIRITSNEKIDTSLQVGTYTKNAALTSKIHTNGLIGSQEGFLIADPTSTQANTSGYYTGIFKNLFNSGYVNSMKFTAGGYTIATLNNTLVSASSSNQPSFNISPTLSNYLTSLSGTRSVLNIAPPISPIAANSVNYNQINIQPTYNQNTLGTGTLRGIYYNPTVTSLNTSAHYAWESTSGGIKFGGMSSSTDTTTYKPLAIDASGNLSQISSWVSGGSVSGIPHGTASGTDTYTVTISGASYTDGNSYLVRFTNGNTTGATLNINGLGAKTLYRNNDGPLIGGDVISGSEMLCIYNSTLDGFQTIGVAPNTLIAYVTNVEGSTITKGQVVYAFGGTGDRMTVKLANNSSDSSSAQTVGVVLSTSIATNQKGFIIVQGLLDGLSILPTSTFADGDALYLGSTAGSITNVKPSAPQHLVYLGNVTTASNGAAGRWYVRVQNGYELQELHNVAISSPLNNQVLAYSDTSSLWKNRNIYSIVDTVNTVATKTNVAAKLNISDTSVFQRKNIAAYSFQANNTNAAANTTSQYFKDTAGTYTGTPAWTFTTSAPTGTTNFSYKWTRIGKMVNLNIELVYGTAGVACTQVVIPLPSDAPTPAEPTGLGAANELLYPATGYLNTSSTTAASVNSRAYLRSNATDTGYDLLLSASSANFRYVYITVQYWTP